MPTLFWDASALAKRYVEEQGSETVQAVVDQSAGFQMLSTPWGYSETFSLLRRRQNDKRLTRTLFQSAASLLRSDLLGGFQFQFLAVTDADIIGSVTLIQRHNINATDAALLTALLRYTRTSGEICVLVAADTRFCRAAQAEGLLVSDPQEMPAADVSLFLAAL